MRIGKIDQKVGTGTRYRYIKDGPVVLDSSIHPNTAEEGAGGARI